MRGDVGHADNNYADCTGGANYPPVQLASRIRRLIRPFRRTLNWPRTDACLAGSLMNVYGSCDAATWPACERKCGRSDIGDEILKCIFLYFFFSFLVFSFLFFLRCLPRDVVFRPSGALARVALGVVISRRLWPSICLSCSSSFTVPPAR